MWYKRHYLVPLHGVSTAVLPLLKFQPSYIPLRRPNRYVSVRKESCRLVYCFLLLVQSRYNDGPVFDSRQGQDFSRLHSAQTGSEPHPASYPVGTGRSLLRGKAADHPIVPRSKMMELYLHSPTCLHGIVLN
jgi:hypothetical protein